MIGATRLYLVTALIYQPPHPWGASDGPVKDLPWTARSNVDGHACYFTEAPDPPLNWCGICSSMGEVVTVIMS